MLLSLSEYREVIKGVGGYLGEEEGYLLYQLAVQAGSKYVLEVGALQGLSTISLALSGRHVLSIDLWNDVMLGNYLCNSEIHKTNMDSRNLRNYTQYKTSSDEARKFVPNEDIGLIFIDGNHSYEGVKKDIENWVSRINRDTWVVFHDYCNAASVKQAVDEWLTRSLPKIKKIAGIGSLMGGLYEESLH